MFLRKRVSAALRRGIYYFDLFHSIVDYSTFHLVSAVVICYVSLVFVYALIYWHIGVNYPECNMEIQTYTDAYGFSLQTAATIGYDTSDIFFGDCIYPLATITCQVCTKLLADALAIGVIYCRLSRPAGRSASLLLSKCAVIRRIRGRLYFMLQMCELRKTQLCQVQIRMYTIRRDVDLYENAMAEVMNSSAAIHHTVNDVGDDDDKTFSNLQSYQNFTGKVKRSFETDTNGNLLNRQATLSPVKTTPFQTCTMRLIHPNDSTGSQLLPVLPQIVVHEIDTWSPLLPPPVWMSAESGRIFRCNRGTQDYSSLSQQQNEHEQNVSHGASNISRSKSNLFGGVSSLSNNSNNSNSYCVDDVTEDSTIYSNHEDNIPLLTVMNSSNSSTPLRGFTSSSYDHCHTEEIPQPGLFSTLFVCFLQNLHVPFFSLILMLFY